MDLYILRYSGGWGKVLSDWMPGVCLRDRARDAYTYLPTCLPACLPSLQGLSWPWVVFRLSIFGRARTVGVGR